MPPGKLKFPVAPTSVDCWSACFEDSECVAWWSVEGGICAYGSNPGCPDGEKEGWKFFEGRTKDTSLLGGTGMCAMSGFKGA